MTYETQENIIVSEPYNKRFPGKPVKFFDIVSAAEKVAFITHPTLGIKADDFETRLRGIGGAAAVTGQQKFVPVAIGLDSRRRRLLQDRDHGRVVQDGLLDLDGGFVFDV